MTQELPLASVNAFVDLQDVAQGQALSAGLAGDVVAASVSGVALDVGCQNSFFNERLPTQLADVWSLPGVVPPVAPEGSRPRDPGRGKDFPQMLQEYGLMPCDSTCESRCSGSFFHRCGRSSRCLCGPRGGASGFF